MSMREASYHRDIMQTAHQWRMLLDSDDASSEDYRRFELWLDADERHVACFREAEQFWSELGTLSRDQLDQDLLQASWREKISLWLARLGLPVSPSPSPSPSPSLATPWLKASWLKAFWLTMTWPKLSSGIAMALVVITIAVFSLTHTAYDPPLKQRYASVIGESRIVQLNDGSVVTLAAASEITVNYSGSARNVALNKGTAYFKVAAHPERPFIVTTGHLKATALGTEYEVRNSEGIYRVAVGEGDVEVAYPLVWFGHELPVNARLTLAPGQKVTALQSLGLQQVLATDIQKLAAWRKGRLIYEGATLAELVHDANRYSSIPVELAVGASSIAELKVRGAFNSHDIDSMLTALASIHPITIDRSQPNLIRIVPNK